MNIDIKATNIELTGDISNYVEKKLSALTKYLGDKNDSVVFYVELARTTRHHRTGEIYRAEVKISGDGVDSYAAAESIDLHSAIDIVEDDLSKKLSSNKGRRISLARKGGRAIKNIIRGFGRN